MTAKAKEKKIVTLVRTCPRCHESRYHFGYLTGGNRVGIVCAECGHRWNGRFKRDEWDQQTVKETT